MKYGINIGYFAGEVGLARAAELVASAGFTHLDYTPDLTSPDYLREASEAQRIFAANGLTVHQTHAPFNRYGRYGAEHGRCLDRCAEVSELLGAKFMVAHGDEFDFERLEFSPEAALDYNYRLFAPYVERAKKAGYKVAFETVFEDWDRRRFSARAEELKGLILSFASESAVCCWDFGHAHIAFKKEDADHIRDFGSLIQCTHLHDNTGRDSHQMPTTGRIDWASTMRAMHDIGYEGVMSVEYSAGRIPAVMVEDFLFLTHKAASYVWELGK
jgi:sugar phosphate isomerase/epimerase